MTISRLFFLRKRNVLDKVVEKNKTHILCSVTFCSEKNCRYENVKKYGRAREGAANMAPTRGILDK
jgi:hypothetical protein